MRFAVLAGLLVLAFGLAVALVRADRDVDARAASERARDDAERARYDAALRRAATVQARFAVSYVQLPLEAARRLTSGGHMVVETDVGRRIYSGRPPVRPDFARLAGARSDVDARVFREGAVREREVNVVGLLVTQTTPGPVERLRLEVTHVSLTSFVFVYDPLDLLPDRRGVLYGRRQGTERAAAIEWTPRFEQPAFVPLAVLHLFGVLETTPAGVEYVKGGFRGIQVASHVVLGPRRLLFEREAGSGLEVVDISSSLIPVVRNTVVGRP